MVIVDSNVILRFLLADQPEQFQQAREFFRTVQDGAQNAYVSDAVLAECVYVLLKVYGVSRSEIADSLVSVLSLRGISAADLAAQMEALRRFATAKIDFVDTLVLALAEGRGCSAFSFDRHVGAARNDGPKR